MTATPALSYLEALASAGVSHQGDVIGAVLSRAADAVPRILAAGIFDLAAVEDAVERLAKRDPEFGRARRLIEQYEAAGGTVRTPDGRDRPLSDLVLTLRVVEVPSAYALGLAVGLQIGGTR